jgi:hypothetical protein
MWRLSGPADLVPLTSTLCPTYLAKISFSDCRLQIDDLLYLTFEKYLLPEPLVDATGHPLLRYGDKLTRGGSLTRLAEHVGCHARRKSQQCDLHLHVCRFRRRLSGVRLPSV